MKLETKEERKQQTKKSRISSGTTLKIYLKKLENQEEMDKVLYPYDHPNLNQENINHLNRSITADEIEAAIKSLPKNKGTESVGFSAELY
jgi:transcription antitermination factor NusA-like protein